MDIPSVLSPMQISILRQIQHTVKSFLKARPHLNPSTALDLTSANLDYELYARNVDYINNLFDYMHKAAALNPDYFLHSVLNKYWLPPDNFQDGDFHIPTVDNWMWDEEPLPSIPSTSKPKLHNLIETDFENLESFTDRDEAALTSMLRVKDTNVQQKNQKYEDMIDSLADDFKQKWVTHRQSFHEILNGQGKPLFNHLKPKGVF